MTRILPPPGAHAHAAIRRLLFTLVVLASTVATVPVRASGPAPDEATARFEIRFLTGMIEHHHMAVMMAELCPGRVENEELLALCEQIKTTQTAEIELMHHWLEEWYGITYHPEMKQGHMQMIERLAALDGAEFEIEFMKMMIRHHWQAIVEAIQCERRAYHPELIEMCHDIVATQSAEIDLMQTWLCQWYGLCNYGPKGNIAGE